MIILPLGPDLMRAFSITPAQFGRMIAAYSLAAAVAGFFAGFVLDRLPRRETLLVLYAGVGVFTLACAVAPTFPYLVTARALTGLCGGVAGSVVTAMVADVVHPARRGRGMAVVAAALPVAQVLGMPAGLGLAAKFGWHAPFWFIGITSLGVLLAALFVLPAVRSERAVAPPLRQMREILTHRVHARGFALSGVLLFGGAMVAPYMAMSMEINGHLGKTDIMWMYACGGGVVLFTTNLFGWLSDRFDKVRVLGCISFFTMLSVSIITRWEAAPLGVTLVFTTLFFVSMSGRFAPAMSLVSNAIEPKYRGGFMSVNAAVQQACASLAHLAGGALMMVTKDGAGEIVKIEGYGNVGVFSVVMLLASLFLAMWLRRAAPWAARNEMPPPAGAPGG